MKRILFAASECVPFIKTGGLADVCGALPKEFSKEEWDVRVVIPNYSCIPEKYRSQFQYVTHFYMCAGNYIQNKYVGILKYELDGVTYRAEGARRPGAGEEYGGALSGGCSLGCAVPVRRAERSDSES